MEIRRLKSGEEKAAYQLSDQVFRHPKQKSMGEAFPGIFLLQLIHHSYGGFVEGELVVFFGLVPSTVRVGSAKLATYSIGSVCTHPDHRGKGYASLVFDQILKDLTLTEASLLLISGDRSLYTRAGARLFGQTHVFKVKESTASLLDSNTAIRDMSVTDLHAMAHLADNREVAFDQTPQELSLLIQSEAFASCLNRYHKVKVLEVGGQIQAFLIAGLPFEGFDGKDGLGIEWAGPPTLVAHLIQDFIQNEGLTHFTMPVAWQDQGLIGQLKNFEAEIKGNQGTIYLINPTRFVDQVRPYYQEAFQINHMKAIPDQDHIDFEIGDHKESLTYDQFLSLFFDPGNHSQFSDLTLPFPYTAGLNYI